MEVALAAVLGVTVAPDVDISSLIPRLLPMPKSGHGEEPGTRLDSSGLIEPHGASRVSHFPHPLCR